MKPETKYACVCLTEKQPCVLLTFKTYGAVSIRSHAYGDHPLSAMEVFAVSLEASSPRAKLW